MEWFVCLSHDGGQIFVTSSVRDAFGVNSQWSIYSLNKVEVEVSEIWPEW